MATKDNINNYKRLKNVLIVRFSAITDVVLTIPVVYSACCSYPDVNFSKYGTSPSLYVTTVTSCPFFINAPKNLKLVGVDIKELYNGLRGARRLLNELYREYAIDAMVDLQNNCYSSIMRLFCRFRGIPTACINDGQGSKNALIRKNNKVMLPLTSMVRM